MRSKDPTVIVCSRRTRPCVPGSVVRVCHKCDQDVWLSVSGQKLLERRPQVKIECEPCAMPSVLAGAHPIAPVEGAYEETREHGGLGAEIAARIYTGLLDANYRRKNN